MKNQLPVNRVEMELSQWRSREERFSKLFSFGLESNKALLKEKLRDYDRIAAKYKGTSDLDERFALRVLKQERNRMAKQLYPNLLLRLLRKLFVTPVREQVNIRKDERLREKNRQSLQYQLQRAGFSGLAAKVDQQISQGQPQISIPVSYYVNEKERLDHQLSFAKDKTGQFQFEGYTASLHNESRPDANRQQYFSAADRIDTTEANNLLAGRAIQKDSTWVQLDFNDKDPQGNYRMKEFHSRYGYDLEKVLQQLPLKELLNKPEADKLLEAMKQGSRQAVSFIKDGHEQRYYIEANPQFKSINIYDEHAKKITMATALGNKTMETVKLVHKVHERQEESQSKRSALRIR